MRPLKILHLITGLEVGGAQTMLLKLLGALDPMDFEPLVVSMVEPEPMGRRIASLGVQVETLGMRRGFPDPRGMLRLVRLLRNFGPDLLQTWMYHADLAGGLALPWVSGPGKRPALVWNIRQSDLDPRMTRRGTRWIARLNGRLSHWVPDHIVCCSQRARAVHLALGYRTEILSVIPNGFELDRFKPDPAGGAALRSELGIPQGAPVIGVAARFDPQKDLPNFIEAAVAVGSSRPESRFILCGPGMDAANPRLRSWISQAGVGESFRLLGSRDDMPRVFSALDILVSPSAYGEGFPNVLGEAMACGVPCVVTDVGDSALIVGDTGLSVPPRAPGPLADALLRMLAESPGQSAHRAESARARIATRYALSGIAARYAALYQSLRPGAN